MDLSSPMCCAVSACRPYGDQRIAWEPAPCGNSFGQLKTSTLSSLQMVHAVPVGQGDLTGDMMDWISCATGYRRKELESVRAKRLTAPQVGSFGISTVWTRQGGTAQRRIRGPPIPLGT